MRLVASLPTGPRMERGPEVNCELLTISGTALLLGCALRLISTSYS